LQIKGKPVPVFPILAVFLTGILTAAYLPLYYLFIIVSVFILFSIIFKKRFSVIAAFLTIFLLSYFNWLRHETRNELSEILPFEGSIRGRVMLSARDTIVKVNEAEIGKKRKNPGGKILLRTTQELPAPWSVVTVKGFFEKPPSPRNPNQFNWKRHLHNRGIYAVAEADDVKIEKENLLSYVIGGIRQYSREVIRKYMDESSAAVLEGMILGNPGYIEDKTVDNFRKTGVMHILAVSGLHTGLVLFSVFCFLSLFRIPRTSAIIMSFIFMYLYVLIAGARPSAVRAAFMLTMLAGGELAGGRGNLLNSYFLAALVMLAFDPGMLFSIGFLLSFLAVGGIIYLSPSFYRITGKAPAVSIAAILPILPVMTWSFFYLPVLAPLINLAVVPLAGLAVSFGLLFISLSVVWEFPAAVYAGLTELLIKSIETITESVAGIPISGFYSGRPPVISIVGFYLILLIPGIKKGFNKMLIAYSGVCLFFAGFMLPQRNFLTSLTHRESSFYLFGSGKEVLLFTGRKDVGFNSLESYLYSKRIRKISDIYILHPLFGEIKGIEDTILRFRPERVFYSGSAGDDFKWERLKENTQKKLFRTLSAGDVIEYDEFKIKITHPSELMDDIRENFLQLEINTAQKKVFMYCGGSIQKKSYDIIIAAEPVYPDWQNIRKAPKVIYCGTEESPEFSTLYNVTQKGKELCLN